jgi:transposase
MNSISQIHTKSNYDKYIHEIYDYVAGIDTHSATHTMVILDKNGVRAGETRKLAVTSEQMESAITYAKKIADGKKLLFAIEGTSSYGETLTQMLIKSDDAVIEVKPPKTKSRTKGKTDPIDAFEAAKTALATRLGDVIMPKTGDKQKILQMLLMERNAMSKHHTILINVLNAHLRRIDIGVDVRNKLKPKKIAEIAKWHIVHDDKGCKTVARRIARDMAKEIVEQGKLLEKNSEQLEVAVKEICPEILDLFGFGPVTSAIVLEAYGYKDRIKSWSAFCSLAGVNPIPASSGKTDRHRLNRKGDRVLNHALDIVVKTRIRHKDAEDNNTGTKEYLAEMKGKSKHNSEIRRSLKVYVCRSVFRLLEKQNIEP